MSERPRLLALSTAVPPYTLDQRAVCARVAHVLGGRLDVEKLLPVFGNAGIERRYSCVPIEWYEETHGWRERTQLFIDNAVALLERITLDCLEEAGLRREDIDAIVVASTTGIATPSLDALLIERLGLRRDIRRLPIFGLGCAGGVTGLARAIDLARAAPGSKTAARAGPSNSTSRQRSSSLSQLNARDQLRSFAKARQSTGRQAAGRRPVSANSSGGRDPAMAALIPAQ